MGKKRKRNGKQEMDADDDDYKAIAVSSEEDDIIVQCGIDASQNLLSQLSSDLRLIILNMLTGIDKLRTTAIYNSLRSQLSDFDMDRVRNCSVYKCQALSVERYRQNLFDEKYKAMQQPALTRALSDEPKDLFAFQQDRKARMLRRQSSQQEDEDDDGNNDQIMSQMQMVTV